MLKKIIGLGLVLTMIFALCACNSDSKDNNELTGLGNIEGLSAEIELEIIKTYFGEEYSGQASIDKKIIGHYYGTYNDCVAVYCYGWSWGGWEFGCFDEEVIGGHLFIYPEDGIKIWKDGVFYSIQEAYDLEFLTSGNLASISSRMKDRHYGGYLAYYEIYISDLLKQISNLLEQIGETENEKIQF